LASQQNTPNPRIYLDQEVRYQCQRCLAEALYKRWIAGKAKGDNASYPNKRAFHILASSSVSNRPAAASPDPAIGTYLTGILTNVSALINATAITVIVTRIYEKLTA